MGKRIHILSESTINKIAAGEVVENPSSVVKELVENAIDAGASHVQVEIVGGGFSKIRVIDNGSGMSRDDAVLSLERHATSKISTAEDLNDIASMGFRGEALASIGAVSKLLIVTSEGDIGTKIGCEGGVLREVIPASRQHGSTVEVRDLFFNTPARKKFQRSAPVSTGEISRMMTKLSLAYPEVGFALVSNDRELLRTEAGDLSARITDVLGKGFAEGLRELELEENGVKVSGFVGAPRSARLNRSGQYLFVNRRCVTSPVVSDGVQDGYGTMLPTKEFPTFVLHLELHGTCVDVNVHPQKREVRFRDEEMIASIVKSATKEALTDMLELPEIEISEALFFNPNGERMQEESLSLFESEEVELPWEESRPVALGIYEQFLLIDAATMPLLQGDGLGIVDLEAASARIHYESIVNRSNEIEKQNLLFPETIELPVGEAEILEAYLGLLDEVGLVVRKSHDTTFVVEAIAGFYEGKDLLSIVTGFLEELHVDVTDREMLQKLALRASGIAKGQRGGYEKSDGVKILDELLKCTTPLFCPRGDATIVKVERDGIKSWFKLCGKDQPVKEDRE